MMSSMYRMNLLNPLTRQPAKRRMRCIINRVSVKPIHARSKRASRDCHE